MRRRSAVLIVMLVCVPIVVLLGAALRLAENEQLVLRQRFTRLMQQRLAEINQTIDRHFQNTRRDLEQLTTIDEPDTATLRELNRTDPRVLQLFVLSGEGNLEYPDPSGDLNSSEQSFLLRAAKMFTDQDLKTAVALVEEEKESDSPDQNSVRNSIPRRLDVRQLQSQQAGSESLTSSGWFVWYWDRGLNLICWQRRPDGRIIGVALERARWLADLIAILPDTEYTDAAENSSERLASRIQLVDPAASIVYQWGELPEGEEHSDPLCEIPVAAPLGSWRLRCLVPSSELAAGTGGSLMLSLAGGLLAVALAVAAFGLLLFRDYARDMRQAAQQVSFVNQVSHELKTPLTNIRMYADLLERDLQALDSEVVDRPRQRLDVIQSESRRLSRLIGNVLTFARQNRHALQPRHQDQIPDRLIQTIVDRFRPSLSDLQIDVQLSCRSDRRVGLDPEFFEQILGNLIGNVEKYAASGGLLMIDSRMAEDMLIVDIQDAGPGIPTKQREQIFRPFVRLSQDISHAAGTGIGLTIARRLARLHGGDVRLVDDGNAAGCCFRVTLRCRVSSGRTVVDPGPGDESSPAGEVKA